MAVSVREIQAMVADAFDSPLHMMTKPSRLREHCHPRQVAMYLTRHYTGKSFPNIARLFGGMDHSTVIHAMNAVESRRRGDRNLNAMIRILERRLGVPHRVEEEAPPPRSETVCFKCGVRSSIGCRHARESAIMFVPARVLELAA